MTFNELPPERLGRAFQTSKNDAAWKEWRKREAEAEAESITALTLIGRLERLVDEHGDRPVVARDWNYRQDTEITGATFVDESFVLVPLIGDE